MWGTIINIGAIFVGGLLGLCLKKGIPERFSDLITSGLALGIGVLGVSMGIKTENILIPFVSIALGALIGEGLRIEDRITILGRKLEAAVAKKSTGTFVQGFVTATLLYCTGSMAIMGSIADGLTGDVSILATKALLDGVFAVILTSTMGPGVIFSVIPVLIYQGIITLGAGVIGPFLSDSMVAEMSSVGGILLVGIALGLLNIKDIKLGNLVPAIFLPIPILYIIGLIH